MRAMTQTAPLLAAAFPAPHASLTASFGCSVTPKLVGVPGAVAGCGAAGGVIAGPSAADASIYDCVVTNSCGSADSATATLAVGTCCPADLDNGTGRGTPDGGVDINDALFFLTRVKAGYGEGEASNISHLALANLRMLRNPRNSVPDDPAAVGVFPRARPPRAW